jgi:hypothetical protein
MRPPPRDGDDEVGKRSVVRCAQQPQRPEGEPGSAARPNLAVADRLSAFGGFFMTTKPDRSKRFDQALGDDRKHEFVRVVDALPAADGAARTRSSPIF